ncbi:MAG: hypothetical protein ACOCV2_00150 [Persicimonas sp.]
MSEKDDELSEDELNSLLADLESRAEEGDAAKRSAELDDGELDEFLEGLDTEEAEGKSASKKQKVSTRKRGEELDERLEGLDETAPDDLPAEAGEPDSDKGEGDAKKAEKKEREGPSRALRFTKFALRVLVVLVPVAALVWVLGSFLAEWVSAGWLIAVIALVVALGLPALVRHLVGKGKFRWWAVGTGLLLTVALIAPMTGQASESLSEYGHWPASTIADLAGFEADGSLVSLNASVAGAIGGLLDRTAEERPEPKQLGTEEAIGGEAAAAADEGAEEGEGDEEAAADEEAPEAAEGEEASPEEEGGEGN